MSTYQRVIVCGNATKAPELRYLPNGDAACNMSVATNRAWTDKKAGEKVEEAEFHRVAIFGRTAEVAGEYVKAGTKVLIEGRLKTRKWQDKEGRDVYTTEIICEALQLMGGPRDSDPGESRREREPQRSAAPTQRNSYADAKGGRSAPARTQTGFDDMDDDIPF